MRVENIKVGSDPELFIINKKTNKVVSSIGLIPGVKGNAYRAPDMPEGYGLQIDNILAEFNIPPTNDKDEFLYSMNYMKNYIRKYVQNINPDLDILCTASMDVDEDQLQSEEAKLFGCSVDYNAYTEEENPKPDGESTTMRSAGVHIHLSYNKPNMRTSLWLIKYMDMYLGIPSVVIDPDTRRRTLYGKAGAFRLCKYGFEYRVLSSKMISEDKYIQFIWNGVKKAIRAYNEGDYLIPSDVVEHVINTSDVAKAKELIKKYNLM